jgi:2-methylcitrate dehydratase
MSVISELSDFACSIAYTDLPADVIEKLKLHLIDGLGCALGAAQADAVKAARGAALSLGTGPCSVVGSAEQAAADTATFVNSVAVRYLDFCDVYLGREVTPPAASAPAALSMTEAVGGGGRDCLLGIAIVYETLLRLCSGASLRNAGWDTVLYGGIASCLGACRLLRLDQAATEAAAQMAAVSGVGLLRTRMGQLSMWKAAASANAARLGVFVASLAQHGMTGPEAPFEGDLGIFSKVTGEFVLPELAWRTRDVLIKRYPAQVFTQTAIEAAETLAADIPPERIRRIRVRTFRRAVEPLGSPEVWNPSTRETADHSLPYVIAATLRSGRLTSAEFSPGAMSDRLIRHLCSITTVEEDASYTERFPDEMPTSVELVLDGGPAVVAEVALPLGHASRPLVPDAIVHKYLGQAESAVGREDAETLLGLLLRLEDLASVAPVMEIMRRAAPSRAAQHA